MFEAPLTPPLVPVAHSGEFHCRNSATICYFPPATRERAAAKGTGPWEGGRLATTPLAREPAGTAGPCPENAMADSSGPGSAATGTPLTVMGYEVVDRVGEGAGSLLYAVSHPLTKQVYVLKHVVPKTDRDQRFVEQLEAEYAVGQQVNHPCLLYTSPSPRDS